LSIYKTDLILQKGSFKPKYTHVKQYKPNASLILSHVRRANYSLSTISREMQDDYDRVSIHTTSPTSKKLEGFTTYYNPYQLLNPNQITYKDLVELMVQPQSQIVNFESLPS